MRMVHHTHRALAKAHLLVQLCTLSDDALSAPAATATLAVVVVILVGVATYLGKSIFDVVTGANTVSRLSKIMMTSSI